MVSTSRGGAKEIALGALFAGLVAVATMIHVPMPGYRIYFNLGEGALYCIALLMGSKYGAICGGIGGALADIVLGYPLWAPFTFLIKGIEGFLVGKMRHNRKKGSNYRGMCDDCRLHLCSWLSLRLESCSYRVFY